MTSPLVSVIIPSYNHGPYILEAVHSVLRQTLGDLELIVVDDGSQDDTLERLRTVHDPRLQVLAQANQGAHAAINRGLSQARGKYLAILNSDDRYAPERLERLVERLEQDPQIGLAASFIRVIDAGGNPLGIKHAYRDLEPWLLERPERSFRAGDDLRAALLTENYLATTSNYVFPRGWFERIGPFRPLRYTHDWDFALRMARHARLHVEPAPLLDYRVHGSNTIRENQAAMVFEICWCLAVHLPEHVHDHAWFGPPTSPSRVDQLLHSIYTFETEPLLAVMLLLDLAHRPSLAEALLEPTDETRQRLLAYIRDRLDHLSGHRTGAQRPLWQRKLAGLRGRVQAWVEGHGP